MSNRSTSRPGVLDIVPAAHPGAGLVRRSGRGRADPPAGADQGDAERPGDDPGGGNLTDRTAQPREGPLCNPPAARPRRSWVAPRVDYRAVPPEAGPFD